MTSVRIDKRGGRYRAFTCSGHAGYAEQGEDIVCAAISILVTNTVNCLEALTGARLETDADEDSGRIECRLPDAPDERQTLLIDAMVYGLQDIAGTYGPQYLDITIREE